MFRFFFVLTFRTATGWPLPCRPILHVSWTCRPFCTLQHYSVSRTNFASGRKIDPLRRHGSPVRGDTYHFSPTQDSAAQIFFSHQFTTLSFKVSSYYCFFSWCHFLSAPVLSTSPESQESRYSTRYSAECRICSLTLFNFFSYMCVCARAYVCMCVCVCVCVCVCKAWSQAT